MHFISYSYKSYFLIYNPGRKSSSPTELTTGRPVFAWASFRGLMNVFRLVPLVPCMLLLAACNDKNAPSTALFEQIIKGDKTATQQVCQYITTGVDDLPTLYQLSADRESFFQKYKTLQKHGYATIRKVKIADPFDGSQVDAWDVKLTPKWNKDFRDPFNGQRCVGEWQAQSVKDFTQPADELGVRGSYVTVTGTQKYTGWATDPELQKLFDLPDLDPSSERTYLLVLKNTGWQVASVGED